MIDVENFVAMITRQAAMTEPMSKNDQKERPKDRIEKISLAYMGNYGRYQVLPIESMVTNYPFVFLPDTREVSIPRKSIAEDGTETVQPVWVKILPAEAFQRKHEGQVFSSLSNDEATLLANCQSLYDELSREIDPKVNQDIHRTIIRKRNYTLFYAYCLRKWSLDNERTTVRENFPGLFIVTAKGFLGTVESNMKEETAVSGSSNWLDDIYGDFRSRRGTLIFTIGPNQTGRPGFSTTATHKYGLPQPIQVNITDEELSKFRNPVATFMGWQALREDGVKDEERKLFNAPLMEEVAKFLTNQLNAVRNAKMSGASMAEAINATNELAAKTAPTFGSQRSNDPILNAEKPQVNNMGAPADMGKVVEQNTNPYQSAPAAHYNPGGQVNPGFGQGSAQASPFGQSQHQSAPFNGGSTGFGGFGGFPSQGQAGGNNNNIPF